MRQILQQLRTGETMLAEIPAPNAGAGEVIIRSRLSLVSLGTERMLVQFGKASLFQKARSQPEKMKQAITKMRTDGIRPTLEAVFRRLDEPLPLGYCNAGVVEAVGTNVTEFNVGDRVASNGPHAEFVAVPVNLVAKIPDAVCDEAATFTVIGAIGLQGVRLAKPELGETFVVIGLGLIGQLAAQLLRTSGCRVIGFDFDAAKIALARRLGIEAVAVSGDVDPVRHVLELTRGLGADGVVVTASSSSDEVISQAARMSRKRGRIVLVGVVGLNINRAEFYEKELTFQVSCSYGPGRYEDAYEEKGYDYPPSFVRWTENRNFQAVLQAMAAGTLQVEPLITRRVPLANFREIYDNMDDAGLASLLVYEAPARHSSSVGHSGGPDTPPISNPRTAASAATLKLRDASYTPSDGALALVGAGNFTKMTALPALAAAGAKIKTIVSAGGVTGTALARKYGIAASSTDFAATLRDPDIQGVIITTRHNLHAPQTVAALQAGKHVLVEKPLCLTLDELAAVETVLAGRAPVGLLLPTDQGQVSNDAAKPTLTVGFNRRFSPHVVKIRELVARDPGPISIVATMNAGAIPSNHWVHDPQVGGGRLIGEACHFIDLAIHLTNSPIVAVSATALDGATDSASMLLRHANGSTAVVNYFAQGHRDVSKERIEVHQQGRSLLLDNFRELRGYGFKSFSKLKTALDKGHTRQFALFAERVRKGGAALIPWPEIANGARATLAIPRAMAERRWIDVM
jgi:predicted dehydrogenase/threonine dehydrogenase-like Zn-dependent dehydrogenase